MSISLAAAAHTVCWKETSYGVVQCAYGVALCTVLLSSRVDDVWIVTHTMLMIPAGTTDLTVLGI